MNENIELEKQRVIQNYIEKVREIKRLSQETSNLSAAEFDEYVEDQFFLELRNTPVFGPEHILWRSHRKYVLPFLMLICAPLLIFHYKNTISSLFMKNIQSIIYPGMSWWRAFTIPLIIAFPGLTQLYDQSCLLPNPFFQIKDMDCRPCMNVINILDVTNVDHQPTHYAVPYIFRTNADAVDLATLFDLYTKHADVYRQDASKVYSTNENINNLDELFENFLNGTHQTESHNLWRCNRMNPLRFLRKIIVHPDRLPKTGLNIERFLAIDTPAGPSYAIPDTECSNAFVYHVKGIRTIILRPTAECESKCRTLSLRLPESYVLMYDWWYWKPISVPDHYLSKSPTIAYIGAYC